MRVVGARPSPHFVNLDERMYACECGEKENFVIAQTEPPA
jgi:hypothetical protein